MFNGKRIVGIIPARGGSKGLPGKNIRPLEGKPLIAWTIEKSGACAYLDRVIVTTDDQEIASVARSFDGDVPFLRPKALATDAARTIDVVLHALDWLGDHGDVFDVVVLLQPTSPLRTPADITGAIELLFSKKAGAVVSVCKTEHHPFWSNVIPASGSLDGFLRPELLNKNRQDLPVFYRLNGAVYAAFCSSLRAQNGFLGKDSFAYIMPSERSIDIDDALGFSIAEYLMRQQRPA